MAATTLVLLRELIAHVVALVFNLWLSTTLIEVLTPDMDYEVLDHVAFSSLDGPRINAVTKY